MIKHFFFLLIFFLGLSACKKTNESGIDNEEYTGDAVFQLLESSQTGISFNNTLDEGPNTNILMYEYFYNGGGVTAADFNSDGLTDLYFTANMAENKLYLNKGQLKFEDITTKSNTTGRPGPWKTGVNAADVNADGKMDIYLSYSGALPPEKRANQLFINQGNDANGIPVFEEKAAEYGLAATAFSNQGYFLDYDKDGDLDMLMLNHNPKNLPLLNETGTAELFKKDNADIGLRLYKNTNNKFVDITTQSGINGSELSYGLGLGIADFNKDGWPDFYVSNDYAVPDYIYYNNKGLGFTNKVAEVMGHTSQFSMGNDVADINNDGLYDVFTLDMLPEDNKRQKLLLTPDNRAKFDLNVKSGFYHQYMRNMLHLNNGNDTFSEVGQQFNVSNTDWSWSALLADYDNDGFKDLFISNGYLRDYTNLDFIKYMDSYVQQKGRLLREDVVELIKRMPASNVVNYVFKNINGEGFQKANKAWGINLPSNSNGSIYADLDNDGDLELVVNNINQTAFIYENKTDVKKNHFLKIKLNGEGHNTQGYGAEVKVYHQGKMQSVYQNPARGYLSSVAQDLHFGLGAATYADSIVIVWNSGKVQKLGKTTANHLIVLNESEAKQFNNFENKASAWFVENNSTLQYEHPASGVDDFERQLLLNAGFSDNGPCMQKGDLNNDKLEDVIIGGAAGYPTQVFLQQVNKRFVMKSIPAFEQDKAAEDAAIAVFDANKDGSNDILIASGGYHQFDAQDAHLKARLYLSDGKGGFTKSLNFPDVRCSAGVVLNLDFNADGFEDIFIGGRVVPGAYPSSPPSFVLINDKKGGFKKQNEKVLPEINALGMITDAALADLNNDGKNELVLVGEWTKVMVFESQGKVWKENLKYFKDIPLNGWWNKIAIDDLNADGKPDIVLGNMGLNTQFKASASRPLQMHYKDFDGNGSIDPIFSFNIQGKTYPYITRDELLSQLTMFRPRFTNFESFADIDIEALFENNELKKAPKLYANEMKTMVLLQNAQGEFTPISLPKEAQYAPVNTLQIGDFNQDGHKDILMCGNNSQYKIRLGKFDANYGVLLQGNGKGDFMYVPQSKTGLKLKGEVRSALQIDGNLFFGISKSPLKTYARLIK